MNKKFEDQFDVIEARRFINSPNGAPCTSELKKSLRFDLQKQRNYDGQIFGFEYSPKEINRANRFIDQYPEVNPLFPLITQQLNKTDCLAIVQTAGIDVPAMYKLGYPNNNCIGCVKGGKGYWNKIRTDFPDTFERMSELERYVGRSCINGTFLDELDPTAGRNKIVDMPDCGSLCDIKYGEIIHKKTTILNVTVKHINGCTDTFVCDTRWFGDYEMLNGKRIWLVDDMVMEGSL